jgi:hydrogenase maturation protein HypF
LSGGPATAGIPPLFSEASIMERRAIAILGTVQGVGFRPHVYRLASNLGLAGFVKNHSGEVQIEIEGETPVLDRFLADLVAQAPPLARIDKISWQSKTPLGDPNFRIEPSTRSAHPSIAIAPDVATCDACLAELFNHADRRYRYPFINCTNCGPRLTIVIAAPYDRASTTMRTFPMCAECLAEYENPLDRRFHAQPVACPACGPQIQLLDAGGQPQPVSDPLAHFAEALSRGHIGALKGIGGYHLVCDAANAQAVAELRRRKQRDQKPFALMACGLAATESICEIAAAEAALLQSPRRPIVLLRKKGAAPQLPLPEEVAPGNPCLGIMLPYSPLHHMLMDAMHGRILVMTSGNLSDEPIAFDDRDAIARLGSVADLFLTHNRPIHAPCDDSVTRMVGNAESPIRRSRGYAPQPVGWPVSCGVPTLAVGGQMKSTFALVRPGAGHAILSQHMGDLDHLSAFEALARNIAHFERLFSIEPVCIAHDLHPDYASTRYAIERAEQGGLKRIAVQHHHGHMASCMAENGLMGPVIAVTFDGTGYGTDGAIWGGEFLTGDYRSFRRAGHFRYVPMPGGEKAVREPWRMAAAYLLDAGAGWGRLEQCVDSQSLRTIERMIERRINAPMTSSAGRLFDAVAALAGVPAANGAGDAMPAGRAAATRGLAAGYEGQAAMQLEALAATAPAEVAYPFEIAAGEAGVLMVDVRPMIRGIAGGSESPPRIARRFHSTLVEIIAAVCTRIREQTAINDIVLSGGVFMNALLGGEVERRLTRDRFSVYQQHMVPPNDGGLALGQAAIACALALPETPHS